MAPPTRKKKTFVQKRGQVLKRVVGSLFSWLPHCSSRLQFFRRNRAPRGRRGNRVPANGGHVEPEPDVANNTTPPLAPSTPHAQANSVLSSYKRILRVLVKQVCKGHARRSQQGDDDGGGSQRTCQLRYGSEPAESA